jgi:hypothetical protein
VIVEIEKKNIHNVCLWIVDTVVLLFVVIDPSTDFDCLVGSGSDGLEPISSWLLVSRNDSGATYFIK